MQKYIKSINIETLPLDFNGGSRKITFRGDSGSEFNMQIVQSAASSSVLEKYYNFKTNLFQLGSSVDTNLDVKISGTYSTNLVFPSGSFSYKIIISTIKYKETSILIKNKIKETNSINITQLGQSTITISPITANSSSYGSMPDSLTSTASITTAESRSLLLNWNLVNASSDTQSFGLRLIRQPVDSDWYFEKDLAIVDNPAGDAVSNNQVVVGSLDDIGVGMELIYHKATTAPSSTTIITGLDFANKIITFSQSVAFEDGETMKFRAKGSNNIKNAIGVDISFGTIDASSAELSKTVRTDSSSSTITLNGTYGISGGGFVTISGVGIKNTAANTVQTNQHTGGTARAHETQGEIIMEEAQTVKAGTKVYFEGSTQTVKLAANITIKSFPTSNQTISLNLDNFITPGVQSA